MATPGMPGGAPPGVPPARPWERAQPGAAQGGAPGADPQVGVPQAQPSTPPPQPARPWERAPSGGVPAGATQAQSPQAQPPAGMPQAQPGTPPPQPARPWERAPSAGVPGDVPAQPGIPPPGAPPQPGMPSAAQQPPQSPPTAAPPARPWERGAGWQSQPSAGWGAPTSQPRPRMPPVDVDAFLAGLQQEPPVSSTPASASAAPAPGAAPSPAPSPAPTSATAPQPRTAPSPMPAAAPVPPPVPGSSSAPRPSYSDFVSSIPTALHETGAIAYSGPPASTSRNPPQHGDGSASPWVAAHRRGFCEIEVFEDLPYGRVLGSALLCDLARPKVKDSGRGTSAPTPAILGIHGGCWRGGHKRDTSTIVVTQWAQQFGFCAMSIEYRLIGAAAAPACYQDVQCALRYLHANAASLNIDPNKIYVIGQSAGGHLAALCATLGDGVFEKTGGWESASSTVAAAIAVAGPFELEPDDGVRFVQTEQVFPTGAARYDTVYDAYPAPAWRVYWTPRPAVKLGAPGQPHGMTELTAEDAIAARRLASPINHVARGKPPILILASETDVSAPLPNAERMCKRMSETGQEFEFENWPEEGHMQITDRVIQRSLKFLQERFGALDPAPQGRL